jgi:hypothetical protein
MLRELGGDTVRELRIEQLRELGGDALRRWRGGAVWGGTLRGGALRGGGSGGGGPLSTPAPDIATDP